MDLDEGCLVIFSPIKSMLSFAAFVLGEHSEAVLEVISLGALDGEYNWYIALFV